jgi:hypothetical protein
MKPKWKGLLGRISLYLLLGLCVLYVASVMLPDRSGPVKRPPPPEAAFLAGLQLACMLYQADWGAFPYDPRGEAEALYSLKRGGYWERFAPFVLPAELDPDGDARFDDEKEQLVGSDLEYLNQPTVSDERVVLLAQQWWVSDSKRWFITASGYFDTWPVPHAGDRTRLVGMICDRTGKVCPPEEAPEDSDSPPPATAPATP